MILIQIMSSHQIIAPLMMLIVVPRRPTSGKRARGAHAHCSLQEQDEEEEAENTGELQLLHQRPLVQLRYLNIHKKSTAKDSKPNEEEAYI